MRKIKNILLVTLITYLLIELVCFVFIKTKFRSAHFPQFSFQYNYTAYDFPIAEINDHWGTWHYPGKYVEKKQCFESVYNINSYGARDKERSRSGDTGRIVLLGDSFMEGYGLNEPHRFSDQLEILAQKEVMNFACGYFTPTQEYLVYKHLASSFDHNTVIIGILPFNDLVEDDTSFHEQDKFVHYQPYFESNGSGYQLIYREDKLSKSTFNKAGYAALQNTAKERLNRFLKEFSFWYNIYQFIRTSKPSVNKMEKPYSGYYDFTEAQLKKLEFILGQLKKTSGARSVIVLTLPVQNDFLRHNGSGIPPLADKLKTFCLANDIGYEDLLGEFAKKVKNPAELYFNCDGHWNEKANQMAAEIVLHLLRK